MKSLKLLISFTRVHCYTPQNWHKEESNKLLINKAISSEVNEDSCKYDFDVTVLTADIECSHCFLK